MVNQIFKSYAAAVVCIAIKRREKNIVSNELFNIMDLINFDPYLGQHLLLLKYMACNQVNNLVNIMSYILIRSSTIVDIFAIIIKNKRESLLENIISQFHFFYTIINKTRLVNVVIAFNPSIKLLYAIQKKIIKYFLDSNTIIRFKVDKMILSGIIIKYNSSTLDLSLRGKVHRMHAILDISISSK